MTAPVPVVDLAAYGIAAAAYAFLTVMLTVGWRGRADGMPLIVGALATTLWGAAEIARHVWGIAGLARGVEALDLVRTSAWAALLAVALYRLQHGREPLSLRRSPLTALALALFLGGIIELTLGDILPWSAQTSADFALFIRLGLAILGLILIENVFSGADDSGRWHFKHLLIGLGALFAVDLYFFAETLLFRSFDQTTALARPLLAVLAMPFILVAASRIREMDFDVQVSRGAALRTTALVASGAYLLGVAGIGYLLRETGLTWGPLLQMVFFVGAIMVLAALALSGQMRARLRYYISRNFFSLTYDYRDEWLRFIATMSDESDGGTRFQRVIRAVADVFECGRGALFLAGPKGELSLAERWKWEEFGGLIALPESLAAALHENAKTIDLKHWTAPTSAAPAADVADAPPDLADWLRHTLDIWLVVPLIAQERLVGAIALSRPRLVRALSWEDEDVLTLLGVQIGSYIREQQAHEALEEAKRFERLSKNFTFVAHDLKNLVSQLSMIVQQAEKHGRNPEFQQDTIATIGDSVNKMKGMLVRLKEAPEAELHTAADLRRLVRDHVAEMRTVIEPRHVHIADVDMPVAIDINGLLSVIDNMLNNAREAAGLTGQVELWLRSDERWATLEVIDNGPGMSPEFIHRQLFKPFASTKTTGYGIGMYQSKDLIERYGGALEAESALGRGTTMRLRLPLAPRDAAPEAGPTPRTEALAS
jgi:putative PEP-CTERM system histidine kinase